MSAVATRRQEYRSTIGFPEGVPVVLYASKLIERKTSSHADVRHRETPGHRTTCRAIRGRLRPHGATPAGIAGRTEPLDDTHFAGFLNQSELPMAHAAADILYWRQNQNPGAQ